jgi:23S rRNA pseudouridine1911/1915/1917 synthase
METGHRLSEWRRVALEVDAAENGRRLDELLNAHLPARLGVALSRSSVRRLIIAGAVRVNGRPVRRPAQTVAAGMRLEARVDATRLATPDATDFQLRPERVLYEDEWLIAVDKPPALSTVATVDPRRPHLVGLVERHLSGGAGKPYVGVHQRLDRDTSGVVLFTKDATVNSALARQFAMHTIVKTYHALTRRSARPPESRWRVATDVDGAAAATDFTCLEVFARGLLIEARPHTGRKHQIRVHLAGSGLSILGDERYGERPRGEASSAAPRLMLHAVSLGLVHPRTGAPLVIESVPPADFQALREALSTRPDAPARR